MRPQGFIDQNPHELRLTLVEGDLDRDQFMVLDSCTRAISGFWISAMVIGASHVINVHDLLLDFNEVFACVGVSGYPSQHVDELIASPVKRKLPGMQYEFTARFIPWQDPEPAELTEIVALARELRSTQIGLAYEFDRGSFLVHPKTVIAVYSGENDEVVIETAHSYPESGLVLSRSTFTHT